MRKLHGFSANMHAVAEKMWKEELAKETKPTGSKMNRRPEETWVNKGRESLGFFRRTKNMHQQKGSGSYPGGSFLSLIKGYFGGGGFF